MAYEVLARKWRPQKFEDVVGQEHVTRTLKNAIKAGRIAHAYLFVGPRGTGKTSIARIFAKALNCVNGPTVTPCDKCDSCREIVEGRNLDVLEIDGASNNTVDEIRELRETVKYMPARGPHKVYIIDEVHMLSVPAFNALLKTLEEPPPHVNFLFATTEPQKILPTILSRCQRFDLRRIPVAMIIERLALIAKAEMVEIDDDALLAIARGSEGGLRDAESALDQLISFKGKKICEEDVLAVFGLVARRTLERLADAILAGDIPGVISTVAELDEAGKDMQRLVLDLLFHFRNLLVCAHMPDAAGEMDVPEAQVATLKRQAAATSPERLLKVAGILIDADNEIRYALSKRVLLETTLIRCSRATAVVSIEEVLEQINKLKAQLGGGNAVAPAAGAPAQENVARNAAPARGRDGYGIASPSGGDGRAGKRAEPVAAATPAGHAAGQGPTGDVLAYLKQNWHEVVKRVGEITPLAKTALLDGAPIEASGNKIIIGFDPEFPEHLKRMSVGRNLATAQSVLRTMLKRDVEVECRAMGDGRPAEVPADIRPAAAPAAAGDTAAAGNAAPPAGKAARKSIREWMQNDAVRKTIEAFDGEIVDVRE